jgi:hypothetical protein
MKVFKVNSYWVVFKGFSVEYNLDTDREVLKESASGYCFRHNRERDYFIYLDEVDENN